MDNAPFTTFKIEDRSYLSMAKRDIHRLVTEAGFNAQKAGEVDIIVSELTSNLVKHADGVGELIFRIYEEAGDKLFELFCIDSGPGNSDIQRMMRDGTSSVNTLGQGLGAIQRLSDFFQIYSMRNWGTIVYLRKNMTTPPAVYKPPTPIFIKAIQQPIGGEKVCGDGFCVVRSTDETRIFVGDGLGHGPHAHAAVQEAITAFKECRNQRPADTLRHIHSRVKKTRGLVASVGILNHKQKKWHISGIGNIATRLQQGIEYKSYMPHNGIVGLHIPNTMSDYEVDAEKFQSIIMCSDGIQTRWDLSKFTSILKYDAAIIAACIFKDYARRKDDMTVLVGKLHL